MAPSDVWTKYHLQQQNESETPDKWPEKWLKKFISITLLKLHICNKGKKLMQAKSTARIRKGQGAGAQIKLHVMIITSWSWILRFSDDFRLDWGESIWVHVDTIMSRN